MYKYILTIPLEKKNNLTITCNITPLTISLKKKKIKTAAIGIELGTGK
jgi:hypothetical protein